jgi:hypothetical protein
MDFEKMRSGTLMFYIKRKYCCSYARCIELNSVKETSKQFRWAVMSYLKICDDPQDMLYLTVQMGPFPYFLHSSSFG